MLFQVHFLSLLLEERGAGDLAAVAEHCSQKLIRRHPHVFGEVEADDAAAVLRNWDAIKRDEEGPGPGESGIGRGRALPANLPSTIYARKAQRRTAADGVEQPGSQEALRMVREEAGRLGGASDRDERFEALGELLYAAVAAARDLGVDAELALRAAADRHLGARADAGASAS